MVAYGRRPKRNQRESAYVSRRRTWRTLLEPSSKRTSAKIREVIKKVYRDRYGREKSTEQLALDTNISARTIWRILRSQNFRKTKPTRKPSLLAEMKKDRLKFYLYYKD